MHLLKSLRKGRTWSSSAPSAWYADACDWPVHMRRLHMRRLHMCRLFMRRTCVVCSCARPRLAQNWFYHPIGLSCGHTFCERCLLTTAELDHLLGPVASIMRRAPPTAHCPECRQAGVFENAMKLRELDELVRLRCVLLYKKRMATWHRNLHTLCCTMCINVMCLCSWACMYHNPRIHAAGTQLHGASKQQRLAAAGRACFAAFCASA